MPPQEWLTDTERHLAKSLAKNLAYSMGEPGLPLGVELPSSVLMMAIELLFVSIVEHGEGDLDEALDAFCANIRRGRATH